MSPSSQESTLPSAHRVFLSYARDDVAFARDLRERLLALGHAPWMDLFDISAGARWPDEIDRALRSADAIIGVMTPASMASENVKNEWDWAIANSRRLVLLLAEPCDVPFHYVSRNYIDCTADREAGFAALRDALSGHQDIPATSPSASANPAQPVPPPAPSPESVTAPPMPAGGSRLRRALTRRRTVPTLVGRDAEQRRLQIALADLQNGQGRLILIGGEAGIGKTTLTRWLMAQADEQGGLPLIGGCYDLATTPPYGPWVEILRAYEPGDGLPPVPEIIRDEAQLATIPSQAALFEIVGEFFAEVGDHRPLLLILEDLHWADQATLDLLRFFSRFLAGLPVSVVATYRDDELTRRHPLFELLPSLAREEGASRLTLHRLVVNDIRALVRDQFQLTERDEKRLIDYLQRLSQGNPLFADELLSTLVEDGALRRESEVWQLGALTEGSVPPLLRQVIEGRLQRLNQVTRELLEIAAVIGHEVPIELWQQVSERESDDLNAAMVTAIDLNLLEESIDGVNLTFRHALIREALYAGIAPLQRRDRHRDIADALIGEDRPDPDDVVTHLEHAFDPRALEWLVRAGDRAMSGVAWDVAIERYKRALELIERKDEPDPIQHCDILLALGEAQNQVTAGRSATQSQRALGAGGSHTGRDTFWHAVTVAREGGTDEQMARAVLGVVGFIPAPQQAGVEGVHLLEEVLERLPIDDTPLRARLLARLATDTYWQGVLYENLPFTKEILEQIRARGDAAVAMARRLDDPGALAYYLVMLGEQRDLRSHDEWLAVAAEAVDAASRTQDRPLLVWALDRKLLVLESLGDIAAQRDAMDQFAHAAEELRIPFFSWMVTVGQAAIALAEGRLTDAEKLIDEGGLLQPWSGQGTIMRSAMFREQGRDQEMLDFAKRYDLAFPHFRDTLYMRAHQVHVRLQTGLHDGIRDEFDAIATRASDLTVTWRQWLAWLAEVCAGLGSVEYAERFYSELLPLANCNIHADISSIGGCVSYYLGLLATTMERWDDAEEHFDVALRLNAEWGYRLHVTNTQCAWADMLIRRDREEDRQRAADLLDQAHATATELGLVRLERLATDLRGQLEAASG